jgi:hypothetical protein
MTANTSAKRGFYPENRSARLWKSIAFAGGLVIGLYSGPLPAAPSSSGDTVQGLYNALLSTMKSGKALGQSGRFTPLEPVIRPCGYSHRRTSSTPKPTRSGEFG